MGQQPGQGGPEPIFGAGSSSSASRMDALFKDWRDQAMGANCWWWADDYCLMNPSRVEQILRETGCEIVIALGALVQRELGLLPKNAVPYGEETIEFEGREILVVRFPHPSGRNRHWNYVPNRVQASEVLRRTLLS